MSISRPREGFKKNPATKFLEWKGGDEQGYYQYYDREAKKNIRFDLTEGVFFIEKDLVSITGFDGVRKQGITSNEVVKNTESVLHVKRWADGKAVTIMSGSYSELKDSVQSNKELHYTRCAYALTRSFELIHIKFSGSSLTSFFDDIDNKETNAWVLLVNVERKKQGNVWYMQPTFAYGESLTTEEYDKAIEVDSKILQPYLDDYLGNKGSSSTNDQDPNKNDYSQEKIVDSSKWREQKTNTGSLLGSLNDNELMTYADFLDNEDPMHDYIIEGLRAYSDAAKSWRDRKDKDGRLLSDYSLEELINVRDKFKDSASMHLSPSKQFIDCAISIKGPKNAQSLPFGDDDDDDDIPF